MTDYRLYLENTLHFTLNNYVTEDIKCKDRDCNVICADSASCILANISLDYGYLSLNPEPRIAVSCLNQWSCLRLTVMTIQAPATTDIVIECSGIDSCEEINLNLNEFRSFNILCQSTGACKNMVINLEIPDSETSMTIDSSTINNTYNHGIIHCVAPNACDGIIINTNCNYTRLIMYEFSERITVNNGIGYLYNLNNIVCNNDRYIKFNTLINETSATIKESIQNEYVSDEYPCTDVEIICNQSSCDMIYEVNTKHINALSSKLSGLGDCHLSLDKYTTNSEFIMCGTMFIKSDRISNFRSNQYTKFTFPCTNFYSNRGSNHRSNS